MADVGVIMGSISDWETMQHTCETLEALEISYEKEIISAHRTPEDMFQYAEQARSKGLKVIIAGAGGAAHLPGMVAAKTTLPVIGIPVQTKALDGIDSLLSIVQMPGGVPVATVAIGTAGAKNAGLLATQIIGAFDPSVADRLATYKETLKQKVTEMREDLATK
ncbi:N5-carboxyaminoimidazole ribonucleotide mutase [Paraliobacillus ryukyuensis]|uniref:N5-carboxyaminoimidazole ribonucleotide mutase n=1 Tax=Paraliobacillus ryukyuensis TaxID=200904 RepID=A0A366DTW0_9BACI|nr:5-(carboxyamino)imidazole ribonucleotide mutase [Paraliobacillus ryukyuensis]RBO93523.1 5-(carboxyamino)imidazole ribonucleotide mutase [Paraliobacillus ryukyuensis]